jgi:hypothetical protein
VAAARLSPEPSSATGIDPSSGAVVMTRLSLEAPGLGPVTAETSYARAAALGYWLPARMAEEYGYRMRRAWQERTKPRRPTPGGGARTEIDVVLPKP